MHDLDRQQLERYEQEGLLGQYATGRLSEAEEMELAAQFLEITSEAELEEFLGDLLTRAKAAAGDAYTAAKRVYDSSAVQDTVIPAIKTATKYYAPAILGATSQLLADKLGDKPEKVVKEELEGLSGEDREFETARSYVRFAEDALQRALQAPPRVPPAVVAEVAVGEAARRHAPGLVPFVPELVREASPEPDDDRDAISGRWVRRGSSLVIELG